MWCKWRHYVKPAMLRLTLSSIISSNFGLVTFTTLSTSRDTSRQTRNGSTALLVMVPIHASWRVAYTVTIKIRRAVMDLLDDLNKPEGTPVEVHVHC